MDRQAFQTAWGKLMARAWGDAAFKERLLTYPRGGFPGIRLRGACEYFDQGRFERRPDDQPPVHPARRPRMVRGVHLILLPPARDEFPDASLEHVAGGVDRRRHHLPGGRALTGTPGAFPANLAVVGPARPPRRGEPDLPIPPTIPLRELCATPVCHPDRSKDLPFSCLMRFFGRSAPSA